MAKRKDSNEDNPQDENLNNDSDDAFGLPEIEYEPIRREEPVEEPVAETQDTESVYEPEEEPQHDESELQEEYEYAEQPQDNEGVDEEQPAYAYQREEEDEAAIWPKILGIVLVILVALAVTWYFVLYKPKQDEAALQEQIVAEQQAAAQKQKEAEEARIRLERETAEKRRLDSLAAVTATPVEGTIETLNERTGRYYVVIASAVDSDLLMDYAKKLRANGMSSKIIPPFGRHKVSRLAIAEGDTFVEAAEKGEPLKAEFGDALWVLKY